MKIKPLCNSCSLNGKCCCQNDNIVEKCGMEEILRINKVLRDKTRNRTLTQEDFTNPTRS